VNVSLNSYVDEVKEFLDRVKNSDISTDNILKFLDVEYDLLKNSTTYDEKLKHQIYDMLFLLFEIAATRKLDLDEEWEKGRENKLKKYSERK